MMFYTKCDFCCHHYGLSAMPAQQGKLGMMITCVPRSM